MKRIAFLASLLLFLLLGSLVTGQSTDRQAIVSTGLKSCRATLKNDTLALENDRIARRLRWNNGQLITISLTDKQRQQTWQWTFKSPIKPPKSIFENLSTPCWSRRTTI